MGYLLQQTRATKIRQTTATSAHATVITNKVAVMETFLVSVPASCSLGLKLVGINGTAVELLCDSDANTCKNTTQACYKLIKLPQATGWAQKVSRVYKSR